MNSARRRCLKIFSTMSLAAGLATSAVGGGLACDGNRGGAGSRGDRALSTITGRVVSLGSQRPLARATVRLLVEGEPDRVPVATTATDTRGTFRMQKVPAGRFRLQA